MLLRSPRPVSLLLSPLQVEQVLQAAAGGPAPSVAEPAAGGQQRNLEPQRAAALLADGATGRRLSQSLLRGLSMLACFQPAERERGVVELARELDISPSTAHRYALTLLELGLLERAPGSRRYRLARTS